MSLGEDRAADGGLPVSNGSEPRAVPVTKPLSGAVATGVADGGLEIALVQMSRAFRPVGRTMLITLLTAVGLLLLPSSMTYTAEPVEIPKPSVAINPTSGQPGTSVTADATGYGECIDVDGGGLVAFFWDGNLLAFVSISTGGTASTTFTVPESAAAGDYQVHTQCDSDGEQTASTGFTVLPVEIQKPSVAINPTSGQPGTSVTAVATGYGACPSDVFNDVAQYVALFWDDVQLDVVRINGGSASTTFTVPESAAAGDHQVHTQCDADGSRTDSTGFTVLPGEVTTVIVPDVVGMSVDEATRELIAENLERGEVSGDGDVVVGQDPLPGEEVRVGSRVDIAVVAEGPEFVIVPNLVGLNVADVPGVLTERGLELGQRLGDGDVVRSQNPEPGSRVPHGSIVSISLDSTVPPPPPLVEVPDVTGMTVEEAGVAVAGAGLVLSNGADGDGNVETQHPAAGTRVPAGTPVTLTLAGSTETPSWPIAAAALVVLLLVLGAALAVFQASRASRDRRWLRKHLRLVPGAAPAPGFDVRESRTGPSTPTLVVRLEPHTDSGTQVLEEVLP